MTARFNKKCKYLDLFVTPKIVIPVYRCLENTEVRKEKL